MHNTFYLTNSKSLASRFDFGIELGVPIQPYSQSFKRDFMQGMLKTTCHLQCQGFGLSLTTGVPVLPTQGSRAERVLKECPFCHKYFSYHDFLSDIHETSGNFI